jgi:hypothetical protein
MAAGVGPDKYIPQGYAYFTDYERLPYPPNISKACKALLSAWTFGKYMTDVIASTRLNPKSCSAEAFFHCVALWLPKVQHYWTPWYRMSVRAARATWNDQVRHSTHTSGSVKKQHYHNDKGVLVREREARPRLQRWRAAQMAERNPNNARLQRFRAWQIAKIKKRETRRATSYRPKFEKEKELARAGLTEQLTLPRFKNTSHSVPLAAPHPSRELKMVYKAGRLVFLPPSADAPWGPQAGSYSRWRPPFPFPWSQAAAEAVDRLAQASEEASEEAARLAAEDAAEEATHEAAERQVEMEATAGTENEEEKDEAVVGAAGDSSPSDDSQKKRRN